MSLGEGHAPLADGLRLKSPRDGLDQSRLNVLKSDRRASAALLGSPRVARNRDTYAVGGDIPHGIVTGNSVQVEDCYVGGTGGSDANGGVLGGQRMLVTRNWVNGNGQGGIFVGAFSTVTHNKSNQNTGDGIAVGPRSLVSSNTANNNAQDGIEAFCPSTITHNTATGNTTSYNPIGEGCLDAHNTFGPVGPPV